MTALYIPVKSFKTIYTYQKCNVKEPHLPIDLLRQGLKLSHLRLAAALGEGVGISAAANKLGITQPAASRLASELERLCGTNIYTRTGRGIELTEAGRSFAHRSARVLREIGDAGREITEIGQGLSGHVTFGSVTGPSIDYAIPSIRRLRLSYPNISIGIEVAASDVLVSLLQEGRLDFALCRIPPDVDASRFRQIPKLDEPISFVARRGHPLAKPDFAAPTEALLLYDWIVPKPGTILRTTVERALRHEKRDLPQRTLTTSSYLFTLALVRQTNGIAPIASSVARSFAGEIGQETDIVILATDLSVSVEPYALVMSADTELTPAAETVLGEINRTFQNERKSVT